MAALVNSFWKLFKGSTPPPVVGANSVLPPTDEEIAASKTRICGMLEEKIQTGKRLNLPESRYALQHCGKSQNNLRAVAILPTPGSNSPPSQFLRKQLNSPISPLQYPMNRRTNNNNTLSGGKRKTHKRKHTHTHKRKHTRKY